MFLIYPNNGLVFFMFFNSLIFYFCSLEPLLLLLSLSLMAKCPYYRR
ncbi:hypothetical protein TF3313_0300 [Tannerella forsythia 3313]|nr:hypothetical protein TF3313_0300 [Tannerella forsythia 3313]